jgi:hypothetical protein
MGRLVEKGTDFKIHTIKAGEPLVTAEMISEVIGEGWVRGSY